MNTFSGTITKERFLQELEKHRKADMLLQGTYGKENGHWKGCAVACSLRSIDILEGKELITEYNQHERYETALGVPEWLARLEDTIFEGLPKKDAMKWPERFTKAIPVGVSKEQLEIIKWKFTSVLMQENIDRVEKLNISDELKKEVIHAIEMAKALNESSCEEDRSAARSAAESAWSAARSAQSAAWSAQSAAWSAAESAWSAARSAQSAAWSAWSAAQAARSAAWSAQSAAYISYADIIIGLLESLKGEK